MKDPKIITALIFDLGIIMLFSGIIAIFTMTEKACGVITVIAGLMTMAVTLTMSLRDTRKRQEKDDTK